MVLRGAEIRRNRHGRCGLLPDRTLSCAIAELPPCSALLELLEWSLSTPAGLAAISNRTGQYWSDTMNRKPFYATRAKCRALRPRT
jgi:hypothetical protein